MELTTIGSSSFNSRRASSHDSGGDSIMEDDAELHLQWAAIEKLPTFKRIKTSLFDIDEKNDDSDNNDTSTKTKKKKKVTDVTQLGSLEKKLFIEKLIKHIENDNLRLLQQVRDRIDRVDMKLPTVEVRYNNLSVEAECEIVQGKPLPTLWNSVATFLSSLMKLVPLPNKSDDSKISILKDVSGIIKPSRLTLLLGPPGCGKTTLLLALAAKLDKSLKFPLLVHLAITMEVSKREKEAGIVPDPDVDTYMKAISVEGQARNLQTDYVLKILGLDICADVMVGSALTDQFSQMFKESYLGIQLDEELYRPYDKSQSDKKALSFSKYSLGKWELFKACMAREFLLMKRNSFVYVFKTVQLIITAFITMTVFIRTRMTRDAKSADYLMGAMFYTLVRLFTNGVAELSLTIIRLPVIYKQRAFYLYPAWSYSIPAAILKVPFSLMDSILWTSMTYYVIGYSPEIGRFFRQTFLLFALHQSSTSMCRFIAATFQTMTVATTVGSLTLVMMFLFGGFIIPKPSLPPWLGWGFWLSPMSYGEIGISLNEFLAPRWQKLMPGNTTIGMDILTSHGLEFSGYFYWISVGALLGFTLLFDVGFILALTYLKPPKMTRAIISRKKLSQPKGDSNNVTETRKTGRLILPFEPLTITFKDVQYFVDTPPKFVQEPFNHIRNPMYNAVNPNETGRTDNLFWIVGDTVELVTELSEPKAGSRDLHFPTRFPQTSVVQFTACLWKQHLSYWRSPEYNVTRFAFMIVSSVLFGVVFWQKGKDLKNEQDLFNILGSMYIAVIFLGLNNSSTVMPYVDTERSVLYRETFAGMYSSWAYSFSQVAIEVPYVLAQAILFVAITYPTIGYYWSAQKVIWFFYASFCTLLYFVYLGMLLVSMSSNIEIASILAAAAYTILNLFSGFLMPGPEIPKWWVWCYWLSPTSWSLNGLLNSQYGDLHKEILVFGEMKPVSSFLQDYYGFHHNQLGVVAGVLIAFPIAFACLFAFCIWKFNFQKR
ncbi:hypothetical protein ACFE04_006896 [Oxalis oulophora]